jgi:hypothetical protein
MKSKSLLLRGLIGVVLIGLIVINILDLIDVFKGEGDYPFGSEFFSKYSIYSSKETYIFYTALFILLLVTTIVLALKKKWRAFYVLVVLDVIFMIYPLITNV